MQAFGWLLVVFAVIQSYLWIFGLIDLGGEYKQGSYFIIICVEFVCGLLAAEVIEGF